MVAYGEFNGGLSPIGPSCTRAGGRSPAGHAADLTCADLTCAAMRCLAAGLACGARVVWPIVADLELSQFIHFRNSFTVRDLNYSILKFEKYFTVFLIFV